MGDESNAATEHTEGEMSEVPAGCPGVMFDHVCGPPLVSRDVAVESYVGPGEAGKVLALITYCDSKFLNTTALGARHVVDVGTIPLLSATTDPGTVCARCDGVDVDIAKPGIWFHVLFE